MRVIDAILISFAAGSLLYCLYCLTSTSGLEADAKQINPSTRFSAIILHDGSTCPTLSKLREERKNRPFVIPAHFIVNSSGEIANTHYWSNRLTCNHTNSDSANKRAISIFIERSTNTKYKQALKKLIGDLINKEHILPENILSHSDLGEATCTVEFKDQ